MRRQISVLVISFLVCFTFATNVQASYSLSIDDDDDYTDESLVFSIWAYTSCTTNTDTGIMRGRGVTPWLGGTHDYYADMYFGFEAEEDGQVSMTAVWALSYRIQAQTSVGAFANIVVAYRLYDTDQSYLEKKIVFADLVECEDGSTVFSQGSINENNNKVKTFNFALNEGSNYYVSVRIFVRLYGVYALATANGDTGQPFELDVNEITVYR